jgi:hypothetical protein
VIPVFFLQDLETVSQRKQQCIDDAKQVSRMAIRWIECGHHIILKCAISVWII